MIPRGKPLSREEEPAIVRKAQAGDKPARDRLILSNTGLAVRIATDYARTCGLPVEDVLQYAFEGMLHALPKFELARGLRFSTYATQWMWAYVVRGISRGEVLVQDKARAHRNNVVAMLAPRVKGFHLDSLSAPLGDGLSERHEVMPNGDRPIEDCVGDGEVRMLVREKLHSIRLSLSPLERDILDKRLMSHEPLTLAQIGVSHRRKQGGNGGTISRERVRQVEVRLIEKLRRVLAPAWAEAA